MSKKKETTAVQKTDKKPAVSTRFVQVVAKEFAGAIGQNIEFSPKERQLATNLFISIDSALEKADIEWKKVDMKKLSLDAVHRIRVGLDAMVPNHIHVVPYRNGKTGLVDVTLQIGYKGKLHYRMKACSDKVRDVRIELVHEKDTFRPLPRSHERAVESYEFEVSENPFDRGEVVGGFGYIVYEDETKNRLIIIPREYFDKVEKVAKSRNVWPNWRESMQLKTIAHRTSEALDIDPEKATPSYHYVDKQDSLFDDDLDPSKLVEQPESGRREEIEFGGEPGEVESDHDEYMQAEGAPDSADVKKQVEEEGLPFQ